MNILLIGNGAREHALADAIDRSKHKVNLFVAAPQKNPAIAELADDYLITEVSDIKKIISYAQKHNVDIIVPGPEAALAAGIADEAMKAHIFCFGPTKSLARLETSKSFTRDLLEKYNIPGNPQQKSFTQKDGLKKYIEHLGTVVVKSDGLCGGKGVKIMGEQLENTEEAYAYALECIEKDGGVVVEEKLEGQEFSYITLCDGFSGLHTFAIQDHKRAFDNDEGPNTGGMGTYNDENLSLPFLTDEDLAEAGSITEQVFKALSEETGEAYIGVMYGGFMKTKDGIQLIEYNARFGDPECQNIMSLMESDFVDFLIACQNQELDTFDLEFDCMASVLKYVVLEEYPETAEETKITIKDTDAQVMMYFGGIQEKDGALYGKGRIMAVIGFGETIEEAEQSAEEGTQAIQGRVRHRTDIGTQASIEKKMRHIESLGKK